MKQIDTIVLVDNISKSRKFYETYFNLEILHNWESMIIYKNRLAFHQKGLLQPKSFADRIELRTKQFNNLIIYIELGKNEDLDKLLVKLEKDNIEIIHGIYNLPWQRIIRVLDPDGNIIEIGEPSNN